MTLDARNRTAAVQYQYHLAEEQHILGVPPTTLIPSSAEN